MIVFLWRLSFLVLMAAFVSMNGNMGPQARVFFSSNLNLLKICCFMLYSDTIVFLKDLRRLRTLSVLWLIVLLVASY